MKKIKSFGSVVIGLTITLAVINFSLKPTDKNLEAYLELKNLKLLTVSAEEDTYGNIFCSEGSGMCTTCDGFWYNFYNDGPFVKC